MIIVTRILIGALGGLFGLLALGFWFDTETAAANMGISSLDIVGQATVRADIAGFFAISAGLSLFAAIRGNAGYLWPVMLLMGAAFFGRLLTILINGMGPDAVMPMIVELITIALILYAQRTWNKEA